MVFVVLSSYLVSYVITAKVVLSVTTGLELSLWGFAQHLLVFCTLAGYKVSKCLSIQYPFHFHFMKIAKTKTFFWETFYYGHSTEH